MKKRSDWYENQPRKKLQEVFAEHFGRDDVEGATRWLRKWRDKDGQVVRGHETKIGYSVRAMCGHVSDYLEGYTGDEPGSFNQSKLGWYLSTKYGKELYDSM